MRGALIHGVLLAVMLIYGYRTWTRDKSTEPTIGTVELWDRAETDVVSIEYKAPKKIVKLERKPEGYWWGSDTTIETKPKAKPVDAAGSGSAGSAAGSGSAAGPGAGSGSAGSAGSAAGSGSAGSAAPPPVEEEEVGRKVREFPLGDAGDKLIKSYAAARALRDLGTPSDEQKKDYKLTDNKTTITVTFKDGTRTFQVGGPVYGGSDKYVADAQSGKAYVLSRDLVTALEIGESSLHLIDPRGFDAAKMEAVTIEAGTRTKTVARMTIDKDGQQVKTWGDPDTKKANQTFANFVDNTNNLKPTEYSATTKLSELTQVVKMTFKDDKGGALGTLTLYRHEKPGVLPEGQELDPANPPKGETEYFIMTEKTRVPALVRKDTAQRTEQDIETVFSGKEVPPDAPHSIDPHGNPFGKGPGPAPGGPGGPAGPGGMPGPHRPPMPHGAAPPGGPMAPPGGPMAPPGGPAMAPPGGPAMAPPAAKPATPAPAPTPAPAH